MVKDWGVHQIEAFDVSGGGIPVNSLRIRRGRYGGGNRSRRFPSSTPVEGGNGGLP
jgi:hypothetical protein